MAGGKTAEIVMMGTVNAKGVLARVGARGRQRTGGGIVPSGRTDMSHPGGPSPAAARPGVWVRRVGCEGAATPVPPPHRAGAKDCINPSYRTSSSVAQALLKRLSVPTTGVHATVGGDPNE